MQRIGSRSAQRQTNFSERRKKETDKFLGYKINDFFSPCKIQRYAHTTNLHLSLRSNIHHPLYSVG